MTRKPDLKTIEISEKWGTDLSASFNIEALVVKNIIYYIGYMLILH